jgi:hypothetical protein
MNSGSFTPYFKVQFLTNKITIDFESNEVISFELNGLTAKVQFHDPTYITGWSSFRILRGVMINGVPNVVTSGCYYPTFDRHEKRIRSLEGHLFPTIYLTTAGDKTYKYLCDRLCADFRLTAVYADPGAAWLSYQFYPTGRKLALGNAQQFFTILRQKYLIFATDYGNDRVLFYQAVATPPDYPDDFIEVNPGLAAIPGIGSYKTKSFLSRDENSTTHTSGLSSSPIHNLGFLPSTASHPDRTFYYDTNDWVVKNISPNLKYLDFDALQINFDISTLLLWPARVRELFDRKLQPSWQWQARFLDVFANTEGGQIPSTLEASAPYTPLNTSTFDLNLNSTVNNLQALAERVDELDTGPSINAGVAIDPPDDADVIPIVDTSLATPSVKKWLYSQLKSRVFADFGIKVNGATIKAAPVDADVLPLMDSETAGKLIKNFSWLNTKASLKTYFDTQYAATRDPMVAVLQEDEFTRQLLTTGNLGSLGWAFLGSPTITLIAPIADHSGVLNIKTPASASIAGIVSNTSGSMLVQNFSELTFIIRPVTNFSTSGSMRFGIFGSGVTGETAPGVYFSRLAADTDWFAVKSYGGTPTRYDTGIAWTAGSWYVLKLSYVGSQYRFYINGTLQMTCADNSSLKTTAGYIGAIIETNNTTAKEIQVDFISILTKFTQRYT